MKRLKERRGRAGIPAPRNRSALPLAGAQAARELDEEAARGWGLSPFALVEAAGRNCARALAGWLGRWPCQRPGPFPPPFRVTALAGSGNNGADALVLLRALILEHGLLPQNALALLNRLPGPDEVSPRAGAVRALQAMGVRVLPWEDGAAAPPEAPRLTGLIIDGIAGTGLSGPLRDLPLAMARAVNRAREAEEPPLIVSVDVPSGIGDGFRPDWPAVAADVVLAVEPAKLALYTPAARPFA